MCQETSSACLMCSILWLLATLCKNKRTLFYLHARTVHIYILLALSYKCIYLIVIDAFNLNSCVFMLINYYFYCVFVSMFID